MLLVGGMLVAGASTAEAQCSGAVSVQDACRKAVDLVSFMTPQLSTALAAGNPTLGQGGTLGGLGHFSIDIRGSAVMNGSLPKLDNVGLGTTGQRASTFTSEDTPVPAASLDGALGLWQGISLGVTHMGGVDALVTATYLPNVSSGSGTGDVDFKVNGSSWKIGYGARIGVLEESALVPGVSVAWVQRDLPSVSLRGTISASGSNPGGTIALNDYAVKTTVWRVTTSKNLLFLGLSAGFGQDKYEATSSVAATVNAPAPVGTQAGSGTANVSMTRTNYFVGAAVNLFLFKVEAEAGQVSGGSVPALLNNFGADANKSRSYFTLGLRFGR
jgi:hypothetical protein